MKRFAVLTSGGDAPGMNAAILAITKVAAFRGIEVLGVQRGYDGLLDGDYRLLTRLVTATGRLAPLREVEDNANEGGTLLGSSRCRRFFDPEHRKEACRQLMEHGAEGLIVIGGNGTMAGAHTLAAECPQVTVVGIPASIDNDIGATASALGVDTALNTIIEACDRISDTARSHRRAFIVEVMGRHSGYLAVASAVASAADAVLLPEERRSDEEIIDSVENVIRESFATDRQKSRVLIIKAEGVTISATNLAEAVDARLEGNLDIDLRATVLGHVVRGGRPSFHDRLIAGRLALGAVNALADGADDCMVTWNTTTLGGDRTADPRVQRFPLETVLAEGRALLDGTSDVTQRRMARMQTVQGVLAL
jgi:6-phosphofructokinase 1